MYHPATLLISFLIPSLVWGHGYMRSPRSRNFVAFEDGKHWPLNAGDPLIENCPHCLNRGGTSARCGLIDDRNYDMPLDALGNPMPANPQATYSSNEEIEIEVVLTAHHMGHFVFKACPIQAGEVATQACFDAHPLTFVQDLLYGAPVHEEFPERGYIAPSSIAGDAAGYLYKHKYRLPQGLSGNLVLLQWHYFTANSCVYDGYDKYNWPDNSWWNPTLSVCTSIPADGSGVPEQFWNCAEVSIFDGPPTNPSPTNAPLTPAPTRVPVTPPPSAIGTCGGGNVGNGICQDGTCCSYWGWCVDTDDFCGAPTTPAPTSVPLTPAPTSVPLTPAPTSVPLTPSPTNAPTSAPVTPGPTQAPVSSPNVSEDSRLVAYLGNWHRCPSASHVDKYTHIVIAFAVSYTWSPGKNICSETCQIQTPPVCNNQYNQALIEEWQSAGKKVLLGFGGAGMGGSWAGDVNDCWEYCFGRESQVTDRLVAIVNELGLDGIDIDYEYFYEDNQNGSGFTKGSQAQKFLKDLTLGLRAKLPARSLLTHAPMDSDIVPGKKYYDILSEINQSLDFVMPQYYNGVTRPILDGIANSGAGSMSALAHFQNLMAIFNDPTKIVFGFCISDCGGTGSNASAQGAVTVMSDLRSSYECNGGAFFWVSDHDLDGEWSLSVSTVTEQTAGCSQGPTAPVSSPISPPTSTPVTPAPTTAPVASPTSSPVASPTSSSCCPAGHTGYRAYNGCTQYIYCQNGVEIGTPLSCPSGLLFDNTYQYCNWENQVTCQSCGGSSSTPAPTPAPVSSPSERCCPSGYTGLRSYDSCKKYYHCVNGVVTGDPLSCATGTLFDETIQNCNWESAVTCAISPCSRRLRGN